MLKSKRLPFVGLRQRTELGGQIESDIVNLLS